MTIQGENGPAPDIVLPLATADAVSATHAAAVITYAAAAGVRHVIGGVAWSYSAAPTGGRLTIGDGASATYLDIDITAGGPGNIPAPSLRGQAVNTALVVTLYDGGSGIVGKINVLGHTTAL